MGLFNHEPACCAGCRHRHIVSSKKFLRTSSSPHKTIPNDKYDAPKEVCGEASVGGGSAHCPIAV